MSAEALDLLGSLYLALGVPAGLVGLLWVAVVGSAALDRTGT